MATAGIRIQPFASTSPWKTPLASDAPKHPESDRYVAEIVRMVGAYSAPTINTGAYGISTYTVPSYQRRVALKYSNCQRKTWIDPKMVELLSSIPFPGETVPPSGLDHSVVIWQPATDSVWELWKVAKRLDGWYACWGGRIRGASTSNGVFPQWYGVAGSGLSLLAGLIRGQRPAARGHRPRPHDRPTRGRSDLRPAGQPQRRHDGDHPRGSAVPDRPDSRPRGVPADAGRAHVARAVQRYGMFVNDVSGSVSFNAECSAPFIGKTGVNPYSALFAGKAAYRILDGFPWQGLIAVA